MASTQKQSGGSQEPSMFLDILTKEEKETLLNKKMEEIRRKNEALRKRHEEIEADKKAAQQMGRLVDPRTQVSITPNKKPEVSRDQPRDGYRNMKGVREDRGDERRTGKLAAGRAKRLSNMSKEKLKAQEFDIVSGSQTQQPGAAPGGHLGVNRRRGSGRGGGTQEPTSPDSENGPPPDPAFNFLSDRSREGPLPEKFREQKSSVRHPRNFGGTNFSNVQQKIKDVDLQGRHGGPPRSKMEMAMKMTGRERREYSEWKTERDMIDQARIDRQLSNSGDWKREWDHDKIEQDFESDPSEGGDSRRTEPGRRPDSSSEDLSVSKSRERKPRKKKKLSEQAGRIGSGRFDRGDSLEERKRGDGPGITVVGYAVDGQILRLGDQIDEDLFKKDQNGIEQVLENLADFERNSRDYEKDTRGYEKESRGGYQNQGRGRGSRSSSRGRGTARPTSGNYDRHRASSTGSDETSRSVEEQNDSLIVKIDNEFANSGRRFKGNFETNRVKRRSYDGERSSNDSWEENKRLPEEKRRSLEADVDWRSQQDREKVYNQENGEFSRGTGKRGRGEKIRRSLYRGGDDGVRADGIREPPHKNRGVRRGRFTGSGRIPEQNIREGDSNLAEVEPHVAMGTFEENWDYGDLQPGQVVQIVSADMSDPGASDPLADIGHVANNSCDDVILSPEDEEEWEDAHDFYNAKDGEDEDEEDIHNSSAESLERFIQEHTLKLDVNVESMVPPLSPLSDQNSPDTSVVKQPLSTAKMLDWGASEALSDNASGSHSHNTSLNAEDIIEHLPDEQQASESAEVETQSLPVADAEKRQSEVTDEKQEKEHQESSRDSTVDPLQSDRKEDKKEDGAKDKDITMDSIVKNQTGTAAEGDESATISTSSTITNTASVTKDAIISGDLDISAATTSTSTDCTTVIEGAQPSENNLAGNYNSTMTQAEKITEPTQSPELDYEDCKPSADMSCCNQSISTNDDKPQEDRYSNINTKPEAKCDVDDDGQHKDFSVVDEPEKEEELRNEKEESKAEKEAIPETSMHTPNTIHTSTTAATSNDSSSLDDKKTSEGEINGGEKVDSTTDQVCNTMLDADNEVEQAGKVADSDQGLTDNMLSERREIKPSPQAIHEGTTVEVEKDTSTSEKEGESAPN